MSTTFWHSTKIHTLVRVSTKFNDAVLTWIIIGDIFKPASFNLKLTKFPLSKEKKSFHLSHSITVSFFLVVRFLAICLICCFQFFTIQTLEVNVHNQRNINQTKYSNTSVKYWWLFSMSTRNKQPSICCKTTIRNLRRVQLTIHL